VGALCVLAVAISPRLAFSQEPSAGDVAQARELFREGMALRTKGDAKGALDKLKAAHSLASTPITGVELGRTYVALGQLVEAREIFLATKNLPVQSRETERSVAARNDSAHLADEIRARIASLTIRVAGVPVDSVAIVVDGAALPKEALAAPRLVNPGTHHMVATSTAGGSAEANVDLREGESREVELKITFTTAAPSPPPSDAAPTRSEPTATAAEPSVERPSGGRAIVYAGFGLAASGIVVGTVTGLMSLSKASAVKDACDGTLCPRSVDDDLRTGRALSTASTISFVAAGVGASAGVLALLLAPRDERPAAARVSMRPWIAPTGAGLEGRF
jgi:hypothetical protein